MCSSPQREQEPQNSEADTHIIAEASEPICKRPIHRNEPNRPHIPSLPKCQKAQDTKQTAHRSPGALARLTSRSSLGASAAVAPASAFPRLRRFGEGVSRPTYSHTQGQKRPNRQTITNIRHTAVVSRAKSRGPSPRARPPNAGLAAFRPPPQPKLRESPPSGPRIGPRFCPSKTKRPRRPKLSGVAGARWSRVRLSDPGSG